MKNRFLIFAFAFAATSAFAQQSLQDQINAVNDQYQYNQAAERQRQQAEQQRQAAIQAKAEAQAAAQARAAAAARARNEAYEDEQRALDLEARKASIAASKAQAKRANDYIDSDLKKKNAQADVVQSEADANRNLSKGAADMMSCVGKGASKGLPNDNVTNNTNVLFK